MTVWAESQQTSYSTSYFTRKSPSRCLWAVVEGERVPGCDALLQPALFAVCVDSVLPMQLAWKVVLAASGAPLHERDAGVLTPVFVRRRKQRRRGRSLSVVLCPKLCIVLVV
jgi:hypothetical protein